MENRCMGCMKIKGRGPVCEHCGFPETARNDLHQLPIGTVLQGRYILGRVLGQGGFGITYIGWDCDLEAPVAIKEFFPGSLVNRNSAFSARVTASKDDLSFREGRERFVREARTLARLRRLHNVVQVHACFQENNTAYIVMEYLDGTTLLDYIRRQGGRLAARETFAILRPVMKALHQVHGEGMIHRDISPDNIMLMKDGTVKILDFGTARSLDTTGGQLTHSTQAVLKYGFAPVEQYAAGKAIDCRADEYALCATAYYCLTGQVPTDALQRMMEGLPLNWQAVPGLTEQQRRVLETGTAVKAEDRYPDLKALETALFGQAPQDEKPEKAKKLEKSGNKKWWIPALAGAAAVAVLAMALLLGGREEPEKNLSVPETEPAATIQGIQEPTQAAEEPTQAQITEPTEHREPGPAEQWRGNKLKTYFGVQLPKPYTSAQFQRILFLDSIQNAPAEAWDVSEAGDGRVLAWAEKNGELYDLYIAGEGGVQAPNSCRSLFSNFGSAEQIRFNNSFHVTEDVTNMESMFSYCKSLTSLDVSGFDTSIVTSMESMFYGCESLTSLDVGGFDTSQVEDMGFMFQNCRALTSLDLSGFSTAKVTQMQCMFSGCESLTSLDVSSFDTSKAASFSNMFMNCKALTSLDVGSFDTSGITDMSYMFAFCNSLTRLDLEGFDTSNVTNMASMLLRCKSLTDLKLGTWETGKVTRYSHFMDSGSLYNGKPWEDLFKK